MPLRKSTTQKTHSQDGSLSMSEMDRRFAHWADQQPTITRCVCGKKFRGSAVEGRDWFREHPCEMRRKRP